MPEREPRPAARPSRLRGKSGFDHRAWTALAFAGPQLFVILLFFYWPAAEALWWSFNLQPPFGGNARFVGFDTFARVLSDPEYHRSVAITFVFVFASTSIAMAAGLLLAAMADEGLRGSRLYRTGIIWPYAVAAPVAATAFQFAFDPVSGMMALVNRAHPGFWDPYLDGGDALAMIIVVSAWQNVAYNFLFFLAGLRAIPTTVLEAAAIDGAGARRRFFTIILPLLTPTVFFLTIINVADNFTNSFGIINVMTQGGPGGATNILVYKIYRDGFVGLDLSGSSAQSVILMIMLIALTILQFRLIERRVNYEL